MPLYICGTPIGNLEDISLRVLRLLKEADIIAAEDTRHTRGMLNHFGITTPLTSYHEHNREQKTPRLIELLRQGKSVALVTDAGMPCISDPGADLVRVCTEQGLDVVVAPGPTAAVTALAASGADAGRFIFEGFLPRDRKKRAEILAAHIDEERTAVFYEAPHHLKKTLREIYDIVGERELVLARELTKIYEEILHGSLSYFLEYFEAAEPKGEYVIVLFGTRDLKQRLTHAWQELDLDAHMALYMEQGLDKKAAMKAVARDRGVSKSEIYKALI